RNTIERRVNALGVSEPLIQTRGGDQIIVELPGIDDPERAVQILRETALIEIIDPMGEFLPPGTIVRTTAGAETPPNPDATATETTPDATPNATPGASP